MQVGIVWEYESDFDDVLIATDNLVIAGGLNKLVALDRASGKQVWEQEVERQRPWFGDRRKRADRQHRSRQYLCVYQNNQGGCRGQDLAAALQRTFRS